MRRSVIAQEQDVRVTWLRHRVYARGPTWLEKAQAHALAVQAYAVRANLKDAHGFKGTPEEGLEIATAGFAAEIAVSLYTGLPWNPRIGLSSGADVGEDVEVKCRERRYAEYLVVAEGKARRDRRYVITYGRDPDLWLAGWLYGEHVLELPVKVFNRNQSPGYAIEANRLLPMDTFPEVKRFLGLW